MCWIHKWRYDFDKYWYGRARTCIKCHRHEISEWDMSLRPPGFNGILHVTCEEYEKFLDDCRKELEKDMAEKRKRRMELKPKKNCGWK